MAENENYWSESDVGKSAISFDDAEDNIGNVMCGVSLEGTVKLFQEMKKDGIQDVGPFQFTDVKNKAPLSSLVSDKSLTKILEFDVEVDPFIVNRSGIPASEEVKILRRQLMDRWVAPDSDSTITRILLGYPFSLELYKSLEQKKSLLNSALCMGDGDAILLVVLFLLKTLKKSIFNQILLSYPVAATHYIDHLSSRMQIQELTDVFTMLGKHKDASIKQFEMASRNLKGQLTRLKNCMQNHFSVGDCDRIHVEKLIKLLEWQQIAKVPTKEDNEEWSAIECLAYSCENFWSEPVSSPLAPLSISQQQNIVDKQFQWTVLLTRAKMKSWGDIDNVFLAKSWFGGHKLKASIPMDQVILQLHSLNAPENVLLSYLSKVDNLEKRLLIARTIKCHKAVVDLYVSQRDRQSLMSYKDCYLVPQSDDFLYAESKIHSHMIKWRN